MATPPGTVYWSECREDNCTYRTPAFTKSVDAVGARDVHDPAHPGKTSHTIKWPDSIDWLLRGDRPEVRAQPRVRQFTFGTPPPDKEGEDDDGD